MRERRQKFTVKINLSEEEDTNVNQHSQTSYKFLRNSIKIRMGYSLVESAHFYSYRIFFA